MARSSKAQPLLTIRARGLNNPDRVGGEVLRNVSMAALVGGGCGCLLFLRLPFEYRTVSVSVNVLRAEERILPRHQEKRRPVYRTHGLRSEGANGT